MKNEECDIPDVTGIYKEIRIERINATDFLATTEGKISVEHRPLREHHVLKIMKDFNGVLDPIKVIYSKEKHRYLIADGQHRFTAVMRLIDDGEYPKMERYPCLVLHKKSTGERLNADNLKSRMIANLVSFTSNSGQERECFSDILYRVWRLGNIYRNKYGTKHGMYKFIIKNGRGQISDKTPDTLKTYYSLAKQLDELHLWGDALTQRFRFGTQEKVKMEIKKAQRGGNSKKSIVEHENIAFFPEVRNFYAEHKSDAKFWTDLAKKQLSEA